jgi:cell wall-associated NlpC family hydrolase
MLEVFTIAIGKHPGADAAPACQGAPASPTRSRASSRLRSALRPLLSAFALSAVLLGLTLPTSAIVTAAEDVPPRVVQAPGDARDAGARFPTPTRGFMLTLPGDEPQAEPSLFRRLSRAVAPVQAEPVDGLKADAASPASESGLPGGERIAETARKYLGSRYAWAGSSPETGFDCSGFAWFVYQETDVSIPKQDLQGQLDAGPRIDLVDLEPGDLVFFENTYKPGLSHVGVYVGDDEFVHAEWEETGVRVSKLQGSQWFAKFVGGSRPR